MCGEAAADPALAVVLTGLGVTTLSMTARSIAAVAAVLKTVTLAEAQELAKLALSAPERHGGPGLGPGEAAGPGGPRTVTLGPSAGSPTDPPARMHPWHSLHPG